jgi:chaperonin GroES
MAITANKPQKPQKKSRKSINLQPLGDRIVVEREESDDVTSGGIYLPDTAKDKPSRGIVISVGDGKLLKDGKRAKPALKAGDRIIFTTYGPDEIKVGADEFLLMREEDVLAVIED